MAGLMGLWLARSEVGLRGNSLLFNGEHRLDVFVGQKS
jgi:hypothetical protein